MIGDARLTVSYRTQKMLWEVKGRVLPPEFLGELQPETVLFDYEGPRSYFTHDPQGGLLFAHQCGESDHVWRYAVVPFSDELAEALQTGRIDLRTALDQPRIWVVDFSRSTQPEQCVAVRLSDIPADCLPKPGVMLYADLEPAIVEKAGYIRELDRDEHTCLLRDDEGVTVAKLSFDESLFDEVKVAFDAERRVKVATKAPRATPIAELLTVEFLSS
ncbi:MAG: hypothetical protein JSS02_31105 [Planctomycetes bacterium]|nr:hypothetical protein [Planctomycetota bacterium]